MPEIIQPSFAKGELSPTLHGRVDTAAYRVGLATARNAIVHTYGGVSRRPGSRYIGPVKTHADGAYLIPFEFKTTDTYILEFGALYMRVIRDDGHVLNTAVNISGATQADPVVVTATSHGFSDGEEVFIDSVGGMTELNQNRYIVANKTANTFELTSQFDSTDIDGTAFTAYTSGGTAATIYELTTPYALADLPQLKFTQSADVMTLVHEDYIPRELQRTDHDAWTITSIVIGPTLSSPADQTITVNTSGSTTDRYRVTAIALETNEETFTALNDAEETITGATAADPVVITSTAHGYANGDEVQINSVVGMTELNGNRFYAQSVTANTFELYDRDGNTVDGSAYTAYSSGGISRQTFVEITNGAATRDNTIAWTAVAGVVRYAVYRAVNGVYGLIGEAEGAAGAASGTTVSFTDNDYTPNTALTPPNFRNPFPTTSDNPGAVGYHEQRRVFGGTINGPDTSEYSQTGNQSNFNKTQPLQADDAITATLSAQQVNEIRHFVSLNDLLIFTSGSEWRINSGPDTTFTFETIRQKPQTTWGCSHLRPAVADNTVIFCEENNSRVRSFGYSLQLDGYTGSDLGILSSHLLAGHTIDSWTWTHAPEGRMYMVRDDGEMLTMSFDQNHEVVAWTHWDTSGDYEAVQKLRHGGLEENDKVYVVVKRLVDGNTVRFIELIKFEEISDVRDAFFVDSGLSLDDPKTITGATSADPVVITSTAHGFSDGDQVDIFDIEWEPDVDSVFNETQPDQLNTKRFKVANKTANTFELTDLSDVNIDGSAFNSYVQGGEVYEAVSTVTGLEHLEGRDVACLADGNIISGLTVSDASITLPRKFSRIHIGLHNICDIETLNIEAPQGTIQGFDIKIPKVTIRFHKSRGGFFGPDSDNLVEMKQREFELLSDPTDMLTGDKEIILKPAWKSQGRIFLRQPHPLPWTLLAVIPTIETADY